MRERLAAAFKVLALVLVVITATAIVINGFVPHASGPTSSSYSTAADGLRGYAQLLAHSGHPVTRLRSMPADAALDPRTTVVLLDPNLVLAADVRALRRFLLSGGRLIAGGREPGAWLSELLRGAPQWSAAGSPVASPLLPVPETAGVNTVTSAAEGVWTDAGATLPALGQADASLLTVASVGAGRLALLADPSPLQNRLLAQADDAALGLSLAGPARRPVAFEEAIHGYGHSSGFSALPARWKWALLGLIAAALVLVAARFRRLGPPQAAPAPAPPPRREHIEALAAALVRTGQPAAAAEPVRRRARTLVLERAALPPDADPSQFATAASRLGLDEAEIAALAAPPADESAALAAGRALATVSGARGAR